MATLSIFLYGLTVLSFIGSGNATAVSDCPVPKPYQLKTPPLTTDWTAKVGISPWPEYPRPLLRRENWMNLNGPWQFKPATDSQEMNSPPFGGCGFDSEILVPFPMESGLSGIMKNSMYSWYRKTFVVPEGWSGSNVLVNFGAVDYEATVFVNGKTAGFHRGGYFRFALDLTDALREPGEENELLVFVYDPTNSNGTLIPTGKQVLNPSHYFYTPSSGIWQTVFLEPVPEEYILDIVTTAHADGSDSPLYPCSLGPPLQQHQGTANTFVTFTVPYAQLWSPSNPYLYHFEVELGQDTVQSYLGFRTIEKKMDNRGILRPFLNGQFVFQLGTLDQGFWPDGLYTAPTFEAMTSDLKVLKLLGFNMLRKHIKIEPDLFYYACDQIGLMVWQDMPSMNPDLPDPTPDQQTEFTRQLKLMVTNHLSFPSIVTWVIFNEGWGQLNRTEFGLTSMVKTLDPTRPVNSVSGFNDFGAGDFHDNHHYPFPQCGAPFYSLPSTPYDPTRIAVQGEFGGIGHIPGRQNLWNVQSQLDTLNQTFEITSTIEIWNYRATRFIEDLRDQARFFSCSGGIYTQTTDVEGETNGLLTVSSPKHVLQSYLQQEAEILTPNQYDRRLLRPNIQRWQRLISDIYAAPHQATAAYGPGASTVRPVKFSVTLANQ